MLAADVSARVRAAAPRVRLRFVPEGDEEVEALRDGRVDLDVGVIDTDAPEIRTQALYRDRFVGVVRRGHPLTRGKLTPARLVRHPHVSASRRGLASGPIDKALRELGLVREVTTVAPTFLAAVLATLRSELVAAVPEQLAIRLRPDVPLHALPLPLPTMSIAQTWHPRLHADPAHRWLRACVKAACEG